MTERQANVIFVPEDLSDLFPTFLENRRKEIAEIPQALQRGDFKQIRIWGHNMAGCGDGYGFPALSDFGRYLESAALAGDAAGIESCATQLAALINGVEVVYS